MAGSGGASWAESVTAKDELEARRVVNNVSALEDVEKPKTNGTRSAKDKVLVEKQLEADGANLIQDAKYFKYQSTMSPYMQSPVLDYCPDYYLSEPSISESGHGLGLR